MSYLLDANVFIEANRRYYGIDFCPHFWKWIDKHHRLGNVCSIRPVYDELKSGKDNLADWVKANDMFFRQVTDERYQENFITVVNFCYSNYDTEDKRNHNFFDSADPWLVATAITDGLTIVTHEKYAQQAKKIIIPNLCHEFDIDYLDTFVLLREFGDCFR